MPKKIKNIAVLTGAGISAESGLSTFRDAGGLWEKYRIEDVATREAYARNPALVHEFYNQRRAQLRDVQPNAAHNALAALEKSWVEEGRGQFTLITQNVDDLHSRAGSGSHGGTLIPMHGQLKQVRCRLSDQVFDWEEETDIETVCECCGKAGAIRPHIVWFGEMPLQMDAIYKVLRECDLFISIGTSGTVYPAAGFVQEVKVTAGAETVEINMEPSEGNLFFDTKIYGRAGDKVPAFIDMLLA